MKDTELAPVWKTTNKVTKRTQGRRHLLQPCFFACLRQSDITEVGTKPLLPSAFVAGLPITILLAGIPIEMSWKTDVWGHVLEEAVRRLVQVV